MDIAARLRSGIAPALLALVACGCAGDAVPQGHVKIEGRLLDAATREPVSRQSVYMHFFCDDQDVQVSLEREDETTYRVHMPGKTVRVRVADKSDTYYLFEETITVEDGQRTYDVLLQPTGYVTLHGNVIDTRTGKPIEPDFDGSIGSGGPLFYFGSELDSFRAGTVSIGADGSYSLRVPRATIDIAAVNSPLGVIEKSLDLTGVEGDSYEHDIRMR